VTPEDVLAVVQQAAATVLEVAPATVSRGTRFKADLRADSLALVEIAQIVEDALLPQAPPGFRIEDEDLAALDSVGDAVDYAVARL
jgi:acyl carrier protein